MREPRKTGSSPAYLGLGNVVPKTVRSQNDQVVLFDVENYFQRLRERSGIGLHALLQGILKSTSGTWKGSENDVISTKHDESLDEEEHGRRRGFSAERGAASWPLDVSLLF